MMSRLFAILAMLSLGISSSHGQAADATGNPEFQHPLIEGHGGIVTLPKAAEQPQKDSKVVLDITTADKSGSVLKGLDRAALILNQYTHADAGTGNGFKMALILHGPATQAILTHDAYAKHSKPYARSQGADKNPNLQLIQDLKKHGVEIYVCAQALAHQGYAMDEVAPAVAVAASAASVNINKQINGYAYIPFP